MRNGREESTGTTTGRRRAASAATGEDRQNTVRIRGRLSADAETRELPSGDVLVALKVVVERPDGSRGDSLPVVVGPASAGRRRRPGAATAATVTRAAGLEAGTTVEVEGWLQRRFWDAGAGGRRSRLQIVAERVTRR